MLRGAAWPLPCFLVAAFSALIFAASGPMAAQMASAPKKGKAPLAMVVGQPRSLDVLKPFGMLTDSIPITVAPGRRGMEPHMAITYSSGGENGLLGLGWDLNLGYVELNRRNGLPASGNPDTYNFSISGLSGQLENDGTGIYHSRTELVYREFRKTSSGGWEMRDGQGNRYLFGSSSQSLIPGALWLLDTITDASGNQILYSYTQNLGAFYPSTITYTGYNGVPGPNTVRFTYQARPDIRNSYRHGVSETRAMRLTAIESDFGTLSFLARRYQLTYGLTSSGQSVITQITLVGADGTSNIPLRSNILYSIFAKGWSQSSSGHVFANFLEPDNGSDLGERLADIDGDGCADILLNGNAVYLGDCKGNFNSNAAAQAWNNALVNTVKIPATVVQVTEDKNGDISTADQGVRFLDVNGDGRMDILIANTALGRSEVWLNTYDGINPATIGFALATDPVLGNWAFPAGEPSTDPGTGLKNCPNPRSDMFPFSFVYTGTDGSGNAVQGAPSGVTFADVNGDGLPDIVWSNFQDTDSGSYCVQAVYLNTGGGWVRNNQLSTAMKAIGPYAYHDTVPFGMDFVDLNGDGKADIVYTSPFSTTTFACLATGSGWNCNDPTNTYNNDLQNARIKGLTSVDGNGTPTGLQYVDYNHDGLVDIVLVNASQPILVYQNTGLGLVEDTAMESYWGALPPFVGTVGNNSHSQTATLTDINGDGVLDLVDMTNGNVYLGGVCPPDTLNCFITLSGRVLPEGMMITSTGPLGEKDSIAWDRVGSALPLPLFVPTFIVRGETRTDQNAIPLVWSYTYSGGLFTDRKFMGFYAVQEKQPNGNTVYNTYDTLDDLFVGLEGTVAIVDSTGFKRYDKGNLYTSVTNAGNPDIRQGMLSTVDEIFYDPTASSYTSHTGYLVYDDRMNLMAVYKNPNTSVTGLDSTITRAYVRNDNAAIWNLPAFVNVFKGTTQTELSSTAFFYDNQQQYQVTRGLITSEQETVALTPTPTYVTRKMTYDQYGNVLTTTDGNGNTSSFVYDTATSSVRTSATDQAGHTVQSTFDPKWGAVLTDTDASGNMTTYQYDAFGRPQVIIRPGDAAISGGTTAYVYSLLPAIGTGFNVTRFDSTASGGPRMQSTDYFDAYGEVYMTKRIGPGGQTVLATTTYDDMSLPLVMSRPYFSTGTPYYTTLTRDPMHRITNILDPDGLSTKRTYAGLQVRETDRRGITNITVMNPEQQVTKKTLHTGSANAVTQWVYNPLNELTAVVRADGSKTTITYDMLGRKTSITDPNTGTFHYTYDNEGHLKATTGPDGKKIMYTYDQVGDLTSRTYPDGTKSTVVYGGPTAKNAVGRMIAVTDPAGTLKIAYDVKGRVIQRTRTILANSKSYVTKYSYDVADRLTSLSYPDGFTVKYAYDQGGNIISVTDGAGDKIGTSFTYNANGKLLGLTYGNGVTSAYTYDVLDRMTNIFTNGPGSSPVQNETYTFDGDSNVTKIQDSLDGFNQSFSYDPMNRLTSATGAAYGTENYTYDAIGNLLTKGTAAFTMDPAHPERVTCMMINAANLYPHPADACAQGNFGTTPITYDALGNMAIIGTLSYTYDPENRLLTESSNGTLIQSNTYDFWGDRVVQTAASETRIFIDDIYEEGANGASHHIRAKNLLLATLIKPIAAALETAKLVKPIPLGTNRAWRSKVDPVQLLASLLGLTFFSMLLFSALRVQGSGRRLRVRLGLPSLSGMQPKDAVLVLALMFALVSSGATEGWALPIPSSPPANAAPAASSATPPSARPLASGNWYYYHLNHLGGVEDITDSTQTIVELREYKPYGEQYSGGGSVTMPFAFDGQRTDGTTATTGLYYFNSRFYNPQLGRFLSADSVSDQPTIPQALNHYAFAGGNPARYVDPSGHSWWDFVIGAAIFTAIVVFAALSGGAGLAIVAIAMGAVGLGVGAVVAGSLGYNVTDANFWNIALTGALIGASVGSGFGSMALEGGEAAATDASVEEAEEFTSTVEANRPNIPSGVRSILNNALKSMAFGSPQAVMIHELNGGSTDSLLRDTWEGTATSAVTGAVFGGSSNAGNWGAGSAVKLFTFGLGKQLLIQGALWTFAGTQKQGFGHWLFEETAGRAFNSSGPGTYAYSDGKAYSSSGYNPPLADPTPY